MPESARRPSLIAALLGACWTLSYVDRNVLSLLVDPVKASLGLSDTQLGAVQGLSFSIFYVLAGLPLARLSDRGHRPRIMSACIAIWCSMTMLCGLVANFWQLLAVRIGVAASEAGLPPAALTMMADLEDPKRLARTTSIFMLAPFIGGGLALMAGGTLYKVVQGWGAISLLGSAALEPWRLVFLLVGAPGLLAALAVLWLREPRSESGAAAPGMSFRPLYEFLQLNPAFNALYILSMAMMATLLNANVLWMPAVLMRSHHMDAHSVGWRFGAVFLVAGIVGTLAAGAVTGQSGPDVVGRAFRHMRWCALIALPAAALGPLAPSIWVQLPLAALALGCTSSLNALAALPFLVVAPRAVRAQAIAFLALISALVGTGLGPFLVGVLSDRLAGVGQSLPLALAIVGGAAASAASVMLGVVARGKGMVYLAK
jgi:MFS family permease